MQTEQGKRKHTQPCSIEELSLLKKLGPQRKDFGSRYGFLFYIGFFVSTTGLEVFL